jgi:hypothetical protein
VPRGDKQKVKSKTISLTRAQLFAILRDTDGGPVIIERTEGRYTHTYVVDDTLREEGRCLHVSVKGKVNQCEGMVKV